MLDCWGLCLETGVQTVPVINAGSILLKVHLCALGQAHTGQKEVSCETEVPVTTSLPPAFVLRCFASLLLSLSGRTQIPKYFVSFYSFFSWCRTLLLHLGLRLSRLSELSFAWAALSTSPLTYTTESCGLCPENHHFPVTQFGPSMFFAFVFTPRGPVNLC